MISFTFTKLHFSCEADNLDGELVRRHGTTHLDVRSRVADEFLGRKPVPH
jgi:hypothetical protein